ncbi:MAG: AI-2E family transporter [Agathobacter sp.]|nr:AI-2E family transporter [Agathobacter sp.]
MLGFAGALILVFLVIRYWEKLESLISVGVGAATPLIIGCAMAYVINILMGFYEKWYDKLFKVEIALKIKRVVCLILAFLSLFGIVALIINLVLPELINCIASFIRLIPGALQTVVDIVGEEQILEMFPELKNGLDFTNISTQVEQLIKTILGGVGGAVGSIMNAVSSVVSVVVNIVIGLIFSLYVLLDKEGLGRRCKTLISTYLPKASDKIFYVADVLDESFHSFIVGQCIEAVVLGSLCIVGMWIFRFPYAVMIGVFIGFTALIPIAGAYIGAAVGAVMILTVSPLQAVQFLIFIVVLQQLEGNLIYPKVVGQSIGLPGIWVLTAITVGGGVLGVGGMLLAVPLFAAGYRLIREDVERHNPVPVVEKEEKNEDEQCSESKENEDSIFVDEEK